MEFPACRIRFPASARVFQVTDPGPWDPSDPPAAARRPHAELDRRPGRRRSGTAAPATFAELGLAAPLVRALAAEGIHEPFAIQARACLTRCRP